MIHATFELVTQIYKLDEEVKTKVKEILHELSEKRGQSFIEFYKKYGDELLPVLVGIRIFSEIGVIVCDHFLKQFHSTF